MQMFNGVTLITLHAIRNVLVQRWPPMLSERAKWSYVRLKQIIILQNVAWNIILPKLLFHTKPHPTSISWHHFNPNGIENVSFPTDTKPSGMDTVPNKQTTSISRQPPEDTSSISPETLLPRPHVILTQTTLCFYTTVRTWSKKLQNIIDKSVDGSCWENWVTSATLF